MITSANLSPKGKNTVSPLQFNREQIIELMRIGGSNAVVLMEHYVAYGKLISPNLEDKRMAQVTGLSEQVVKRTRLALTKEGWFRRIKTTSKGETLIVYLVGKQAVNQGFIASIHTKYSPISAGEDTPPE